MHILEELLSDRGKRIQGVFFSTPPLHLLTIYILLFVKQPVCHLRGPQFNQPRASCIMINLPVVEHVSRLVIELASRTKAEYDAEEDVARDEAEEVT